MTTNRSAEELAMRDAIETWGRQFWPGARVVRELVCGSCRIDMAFIAEATIVGVEIKGPKDTLDRLDKQMREFNEHLPEVLLIYDERWASHIEAGYVYSNAYKFAAGKIVAPFYRPRPNVMCTAPMLHLLWRDEAYAIAVRKRLVAPRSRTPQWQLNKLLARKLTGDEIVAEVCRELRARGEGRNGKAFWRSDPPIGAEPSVASTPAPVAAGLFGAAA